MLPALAIVALPVILPALAILRHPLLGRENLAKRVAAGIAFIAAVALLVQLVGDDRHSGDTGGGTSQIANIGGARGRGIEGRDQNGGCQNGSDEFTGHAMSSQSVTCG